MSTKALFRAVQNENVAEVKKLLSNKVVTHGRDKDQQTVLHIAASSGNLGLVQLLLKKVPVNAKDVNGWTALHCAANGAHFAVCEALLMHKNIDATVLNNELTGPLMYLARQTDSKVNNRVSDYLRVMKLMVENKADVNAINEFGESPLHTACWKGNIYSVQFLLNNHANVNKLNHKKETPLHWAVRRAKPDLTQVLMGYGADPFIASGNGSTPMELAIEANQQSLVQLMTGHALLCVESQVECNKKGFLEVNISTTKNRWKKMFFVLKEEMLFVYKNDEPDAKPKGSYNIMDLEVDVVTQQGKDREKRSRPYVFRLTQSFRITTVAAESEIDLMDWTSSIDQGKKIQKNIELADQKREQEKSDPNKSSTAESKKSEPSLSSEEVAGHLMSVLMLPGNDCCADCEASAAFWILLKFGIAVCFECAEIHARLKTSEVRSVHFGTWELGDVMKLRCNGNAKSNGKLEQVISLDFDKPTPRDSAEVKEKFIQAKYIKNSFIKPEESPHSPRQQAFMAAIFGHIRVFEKCYNVQNMLNALSFPLDKWTFLTEKSSLFKQVGIALQTDRTEKFDKMLGDYLTENFKYTMQDRIDVVTGCTQVARTIFKGNATGEVVLEPVLQLLRKLMATLDALRKDWPHDDHQQSIIKWWLPQVVEVLTINHVSSKRLDVTRYMEKFKENSIAAIYGLCGEYLYDGQLVAVLNERSKSKFHKRFATLSSRVQAQTESVRKLLHTAYKYKVAMQKPSTNRDLQMLKRLESLSLSDYNLSERLPRTPSLTWSGGTQSNDQSPRSEPVTDELMVLQGGHKEHTVLAFAAACPETMAAVLGEAINALGEYGQDLLGVVPIGENNWLPMEPVDRDNLFTEFPEWTKACRSAFTHVGLLQTRLQRLRENWPTLFDRDCTVLGPEARHFVVREMFILKNQLSAMFYHPVPWTIPDVFSHWLTLGENLKDLVAHLALCALEGLDHSTVVESINLTLVHLRWTVSKLMEVEVVEEGPSIAS
mmetsp:Transcript_18517/g.71491  ORF Transcript_18517/g.71491 Transcript_18517/m.71491 type:complete len:998 (+) Transcript_18517:179-3172(+)|eukprot:CAMPEP_0114624860 /NCGR_PEP_ID=MMETSP0168-20121206/10978_1 /TAXON_ID=95228 ORGANISM="Vannella sp., Strain DIVA3 517/6/12" /NCGR_SAMPLE_ID=MMETSP0168 /ASSEMBLY_ACC=CAM_ASM_000044 /LENGTH=997 /DNA_ID=CAMNT_0001836135 /DNA_START=140 /DNA_END=3133 /DNA_ORIENTATION=+